MGDAAPAKNHTRGNAVVRPYPLLIYCGDYAHIRSSLTLHAGRIKCACRTSSPSLPAKPAVIEAPTSDRTSSRQTWGPATNANGPCASRGRGRLGTVEYPNFKWAGLGRVSKCKTLANSVCSRTTISATPELTGHSFSLPSGASLFNLESLSDRPPLRFSFINEINYLPNCVDRADRAIYKVNRI